jgi:hypothetical protein
MMSKLRLTLNRSSKARPSVYRVVDHQGREEIRELLKHRSAYTATFELEEGFYESFTWCDACDREVHRFMLVKRGKDGELYGEGITKEGADWLCDKIGERWSEAFPEKPDLSSDALRALTSGMPSTFLNRHLVLDAPPPAGLWAAAKSMLK